MVDLTEHINRSSVTFDKVSQSLHPLVHLAVYSDITKAAEAQYKMRTTTQRLDPDYAVSYTAGRGDVILSGFLPLYLPPDAAYVTATGVLFAPDDALINDILKPIYQIQPPTMNKAQLYNSLYASHNSFHYQ